MDISNTAIILAGGKSLRMKFDKQFLVIDNERLMHKVIKNLERHFKEIIIVTNKPEQYENSKYTIICDDIKNVGPLGGILAGLSKSKSKYSYIVACDMPNIDNYYINYLKNKIVEDLNTEREYSVYISNIKGRFQFFHGFYKTSLKDNLYAYIYNEKSKSIRSFLNSQNIKVNVIHDEEFKQEGFNEDIYINLNTQEDLKKYIGKSHILY